MLYNCYMLDITVALIGQLALYFISLNNALFDIISVCSNTEWLSYTVWLFPDQLTASILQLTWRTDRLQ